MIYLEFLDGQGLGNQLWNYITLRSISNKLGFNYKVINPKNFKGKDFLDISYSDVNIKISSNNKENYYKNIFEEKLFYDNELKTFASDFDNKILSIKPKTIIKGLFQSEDYFFKNNINDFIKLKNSFKNKYNSKENECLINIRGGEYKRFNNLILPKSYWINAINNMKKINHKLNFKIITDDYDYASNLLPEIQILKGNISDDFLRIYYANYLIVSNSSFAYFPAELGFKPLKIIAPANWARFGNPYNKWISPANHYKNWSYQNIKGEIITKKLIEESINKTRSIFSSYNVTTTKESLSQNKPYQILPNKLRKILKKFLSKIFPLHIG